MDAASVGEPRNLGQALADLIASECPSCTLLNAGCAQDALVTGHMGATCPIPTSAYSTCSGCGRNVCTAECGSRQDTRLSRAMLLAMVLAAFRVDDPKSPSAARISQSVKVWEENNTLALLNAHAVVVDGMAVPALNKRSLAAFTGWWQVLPLGQGVVQGSRWACCAAGVQDALNMPGFLRKFAAVNLRGYSGAQASSVRLRDQGRGEEEGEEDRASDLVTLQRQVAALQKLNQEQEQNVRALTTANEALRTGASVAVGPMGGAVFQPVLQGSKFGQIDTRSALNWGKCHLLLENVLCSSGFVREAIISVHSLIPSLCDACDPGKNKEQKCRVTSFLPGTFHVEVPRVGLEALWAQKFTEFRSTLKQFGSEGVLCAGFYTATQFFALYELLEKAAQRLHDKAAADKSDMRTPIRCTSFKIVEVVDTIIKALLDEAFRFGKVIDPLDVRNLVVLEGLQSVGPTFTESRTRPKRPPQGDRVGETLQNPPKAQASGKERRAGEICYKFNKNEYPCNNTEPCRTGQMHVCLKCKGAHAQSLTASCK
jgi:hypothetical protein